MSPDAVLLGLWVILRAAHGACQARCYAPRLTGVKPNTDNQALLNPLFKKARQR